MNHVTRFYLETYGCQSNRSDSEIISGILRSVGYRQTKKSSSADMLVFNTCYVKQSTQNRIINRLKQFKKSAKKIVVAGCMPEIEQKRIKSILPKSILVSAGQVHKITDAIKNKKDFLGKSEINKTCLPKASHPKIYTIQISEGCNNSCSYCAAKQARGNIYSFSSGSIMKELKKTIARGYKTIYVTSQDNAAYGLDKHKKSRLSELLNKMTSLKGEFRIRVGMMNPSNVIPVLNPLINSFNSPKIIPFLHLPAKSGSRKILRHMNRKYDTRQYVGIIKEFRKRVPNISISTDIIVGYPTETEKDFQQTISLIKKIKPEILNISRYSRRPNTPEAKQNLKLLKTQELKRRSRILTRLHDKIKDKKIKKKRST